jgi:RNA polymerase sigma-70 factor (ECF subfamily)
MPQRIRRLDRPLHLVADGESTQPRPQTDAEIVRALREDDARAPAMLWDRHSVTVRRMLARALGPRSDVEDLVQEVFLRVFVRVPSLRDPSALRPFILSIAGNVLKWEIRRRWVGRRIRLSMTGSLPEIETTSDDPESRQALKRCYVILETLTAKERLAFVFRLMEGMTTEEVAAALSVSASTAKRLVNRASAKVSEQVQKDPGLRSFFALSAAEERE